jgi:hypothetical protein
VVALLGEIARLSYTLEEATAQLGQTRDELRATQDELTSRRKIEERAQQALAVALRVLDGQPTA